MNINYSPNTYRILTTRLISNFKLEEANNLLYLEDKVSPDLSNIYYKLCELIFKTAYYVETIFCNNLTDYEDVDISENIKIKIYGLFDSYKDDLLFSVVNNQDFKVDEIKFILDILEYSISVFVGRIKSFRIDLYSDSSITNLSLLDYYKNILDMFYLFISHHSYIMREINTNFISNKNGKSNNFIYIDNFEISTNEIISYGSSGEFYRRSPYVYYRMKLYKEYNKSVKYVLLNESDFTQFEVPKTNHI